MNVDVIYTYPIFWLYMIVEFENNNKNFPNNILKRTCFLRQEALVQDIFDVMHVKMIQVIDIFCLAQILLNVCPCVLQYNADYVILNALDNVHHDVSVTFHFSEMWGSG